MPAMATPSDRERTRSRMVDTRETLGSGIDLYWLPLGAGGWFVRLNGRVYESIRARRDRRRPLALYHSALEVRVPEGRFVVENSWPIPDVDGAARGVVVQGPVGSRWMARWRVFRYEVRCWPDGVIADAGEAVESPRHLSDDPLLARHVLDLVGSLPSPAWGGRDRPSGRRTRTGLAGGTRHGPPRHAHGTPAKLAAGGALRRRTMSMMDAGFTDQAAPDRRLTGPVAITGADGHVGRALRRRLARLPNAVRALGRSDEWQSGIADADAVVHLAGTLQPRRPNTYHAANVGTVQRCLDALAGSSVQRLVLLSYLGADPAAGNAYLRTKGRAERLAAGAPVTGVVLRSSYVYGDPDDIGPSFTNYLTRPGGTVRLLGDGEQRLAPLHVDDLADLLMAAALDADAPAGTFEAGGPTTSTLDAFVRRINPPDVTLRHLPAAAARLLAHVLPQLTPALVDVLLNDSVPGSDPHEVAGRFGVTLHDIAATASSQGG